MYWSDIPAGTKAILIIAVLLLVSILAVGALRVFDARVNQAVDYTNLSATTQSTNNLLAQSERFNNAYYSLQAVKGSMQSVETQRNNLRLTYGEDMNTWPLEAKQEYTQLGQTLTQYDVTYRQACASYLAAWDNEFVSVVAPKDLPRSCD